VVFKEHGALKFVECWGDDVPDGSSRRFLWRSIVRMMRQSSFPGSSGRRAMYETRP
jgi:uncharacterized protein YbaA (DUF1428 family)